MSEIPIHESSRPERASADTGVLSPAGSDARTQRRRRRGPRHDRGARLGDYVIDSFIAEGGFGSVYRASHPRLGGVALKVSHVPAHELSPECLALQQNELEALRQLRHPALVRVLDHGSLADHRQYLALELVPGESLHRYMVRRGRVDAIEAIAIMRRLADGIAHCHQFDVLHLDLTPSNVIVVDPFAPEIKIVDFGVAAFTASWLDVERRPAAGTPRYMAPEMVADPPQIGSHCDVFALGLMFYELITGAFPFEGPSSAQLFRSKRRGELRPVTALVPDVPAPIAAAIHALLHPRPSQRGFTAASLAGHLKELYFDILRRDRGARRDRPSTGEAPAPATPLIGRDAELYALVLRASAALRAPSAPSAPSGATAAMPGDPPGWAVVITGDPGIGKTRVIAELSQRLELARCATGYGRCREHGSLVSYAGWRECLGQLERVVSRTSHPHGDAARAAVRALLADPALADLYSLLPELEPARDPAGPAPAAAAVDVGSARMSQAVQRLITAICAHLPTAIVLEDLHWADQGTLDLLAALVAAPIPPGLLILCTARPEAALPSSPALDRLRLEPLDERRSAQLLRALAGDMPPEVIAELTAAIPLLRLGNPLVDTQVILHLKREGLLGTDAAGRVVLSERFDRDYEPPTTIAAVLERRLRHVAPRAREVLGVASLFGRQFRISDLARVTAPEHAASDVADAVREAVALSLCRADHDDCAFVHDVIRDHLETTVPAARGPVLHARIARVLGARATPSATLAHHLDRAGDREAAAARYFAGGIEADRVHDLVGSSRNLGRALALMLELPASPARDRELARTGYELARITCLLGKTDEPLEHLERCRAAIPAPSPAAAALLDSAYARVYYARGEFGRAMDHSARSLAVHDPELGPELGRAQCVPANMLGRALCASGHFGPSIPVLRRGCKLARDAHDLVELAHSEGLLGTSLAFVGELARSRRHIAESQRITELLDDPGRRMAVCLYRTLYAEAAFDWESGIRTSAQLLTHADEYAIAGLYFYLGTLMAGRHHFHIGELGRARHLLGNAINLSGLFGIRIARSWAHAYLGDVHFVDGRIEEARRWYASALELGRAGRGDGLGVPLGLIGMAHALARLGADRASVIELAHEAFRAFDAASNLSGQSVARVRLLEILAGWGDAAERAAEVTAELAAGCARLGVVACAFWPVLPETATAADRALPPATYWQQRAASAAAPGPGAREAGDLLASLSTVEGFVPPFAARSLR
jgi:serine/threonine protein kinase/tetratricopeptide (TPR) repeat protein